MDRFEPYLEGWRKRWAAEREADADAGRRARAVAERLAVVLRDRFAARRVILTGSLARGGFGENSDIDLAVEGVRDDQFFRAGAELERAADGFAVDLVPLESAAPEYRTAAEEEGVVLHDGLAR
ncbi:MAG: nucleotidyltransferase domain-containing protein [Deltaproteobacteria bacterium]|nr:nucleotidyltransferase domain-containing protein [Deltaproteobacteria bacterium]